MDDRFLRMSGAKTAKSVSALILAGALIGAVMLHQLEQSPTVKADSGWRTVALPSRPISITATADTLWVSGTNELIARSSDGGQTWQVKHQNTDGDVLMNVHFSDEERGYASGTNGLILWTHDSGESWQSQHAGAEPILDISFADEKHGIRYTRLTVETTSDGTTWSSIPPLNPQEAEQFGQFQSVFGLAAIDAAHMAVLLKPGRYRDQIIRSTSDGGKSWATTYIPSTGISSLLAHGGIYWAFGHEVIEKDKPGGGYGVALALHSNDGVNWTHGVRSPNEFSDCETQGCILWDGAIVELYGEKPRYIAVPADGTLTTAWAWAKGSVCTVGVTLKCDGATYPEAPPARPEWRRPIPAGFAPDAARSLPDCLVCDLRAFPMEKSRLGKNDVKVNMPGGQSRMVQMPGLKAEMSVEFVVQRDGSVRGVRVGHSPNKQIEAAVSEIVRGWVFVPPRQDGKPTESKHDLTLSVLCSAFPSNEEATCAVHVP